MWLQFVQAPSMEQKAEVQGGTGVFISNFEFRIAENREHGVSGVRLTAKGPAVGFGGAAVRQAQALRLEVKDVLFYACCLKPPTSNTDAVCLVPYAS